MCPNRELKNEGSVDPFHCPFKPVCRKSIQMGFTKCRYCDGHTISGWLCSSDMLLLKAHIPLQGTGREITDSYHCGRILKSQLTSGARLIRFVTANEALNGISTDVFPEIRLRLTSKCGHRWKILVSVTLQEKGSSKLAKNQERHFPTVNSMANKTKQSGYW
jgi:hypothetical protein